MALIGRLHPLLVHFPIGLLLAAAAAELVAIHSGRAEWQALALANLRAGAGMGVLTAVAGWGLVRAPFVEPSRLLAWHEWIGTVAAVGSLAAALLSAGGFARTRRGLVLYRTALFGTAALVAVAGHLGGALVWGAGFLGP